MGQWLSVAQTLGDVVLIGEKVVNQEQASHCSEDYIILYWYHLLGILVAFLVILYLLSTLSQKR